MKLLNQVKKAVEGLSEEQLKEVVIAYEQSGQSVQVNHQLQKTLMKCAHTFVKH